ncbi:hypothetical protein DA096_10285 [Vibrio rotiferianus]|uniref:hypothetical protein n=1 Tax=Vibrio harveyi group TaxID=717610 RepID=UPI001110E813|nr:MULTISPECIES: hypothetical protein [Vibrio harveyi group]MDF5484221.1 hypothetical protein [Vibrio parahaemolyticus]MDG2839805.1 hypothetical protein [Vibrio parahaemolyticus]MDV5082450.1 hypothetical protein [Vibrio parahaemolyticus]TMX33477.1 hypothetical protein DA095_17440 [Vibrio rotiferianus]TMX48251.1 hypothetical protein DA093_17000 [Vibrio rotiferianus]
MGALINFFFKLFNLFIILIGLVVLVGIAGGYLWGMHYALTTPYEQLTSNGVYSLYVVAIFFFLVFTPLYVGFLYKKIRVKSAWYAFFSHLLFIAFVFAGMLTLWAVYNEEYKPLTALLDGNYIYAFDWAVSTVLESIMLLVLTLIGGFTLMSWTKWVGAQRNFMHKCALCGEPISIGGSGTTTDEYGNIVHKHC